jgi:hypothetical protein
MSNQPTFAGYTEFVCEPYVKESERLWAERGVLTTKKDRVTLRMTQLLTQRSELVSEIEKVNKEWLSMVEYMETKLHEDWQKNDEPPTKTTPTVMPAAIPSVDSYIVSLCSDTYPQHEFTQQEIDKVDALYMEAEDELYDIDVQLSATERDIEHNKAKLNAARVMAYKECQTKMTRVAKRIKLSA